jgi:lipopolysaccharide export system permease protein
MLSIMGERSAKEGAMTPFIGMWIPTFVLLPIGFYLTWRANIDKISFSFDKPRRFFSYIFSVFRKKKNIDADTAAL